MMIMMFIFEQISVFVTSETSMKNAHTWHIFHTQKKKKTHKIQK